MPYAMNPVVDIMASHNRPKLVGGADSQSNAVILAPGGYERWLAPADPAHLPIDLLRPYPAEEMKAWKVGKAVGNTRNNDASLVEPLKENAPSPTTLPLFE